MVSHSIDAPDVNANLTEQLHQLKIEMRKELTTAWQSEAPLIGRYLVAAQARMTTRADADELAKGLDAIRLEKWIAALKVEKAPLEDPLEPARRLVAAADPAVLLVNWRKLVDEYLVIGRE